MSELKQQHRASTGASRNFWLFVIIAKKLADILVLCMTWSKVKITEPSKLETFPFLVYLLRHLQRGLADDCSILSWDTVSKLDIWSGRNYHFRSSCPSFCVTWTWKKNYDVESRSSLLLVTVLYKLVKFVSRHVSNNLQACKVSETRVSLAQSSSYLVNNLTCFLAENYYLEHFIIRLKVVFHWGTISSVQWLPVTTKRS